ncbi:MAG: hypothetical protein ACPGVU_17485 [Limisphaerales bacterium]
MWTQVPNSPPAEFTLNKPVEFLRIKCDVHPWMFAYLTVVPHSYFAVTDTNGQFQIKHPPHGRYQLRAHHRKLGILEHDLVVPSERPVRLEFRIPQEG